MRVVLVVEGVIDELGIVDDSQTVRCASFGDSLIQPVDDFTRVDQSSDVLAEAFAHQLVDDAERIERAKVTSLVELQVHRSNDHWARLAAWCQRCLGWSEIRPVRPSIA